MDAGPQSAFWSPKPTSARHWLAADVKKAPARQETSRFECSELKLLAIFAAPDRPAAAYPFHRHRHKGN